MQVAPVAVAKVLACSPIKKVFGIPRLFAYAVAVVFLFGLNPIVSAQTKTTGPVLRIINPRYDFGDLKQGQSVEKKFEVTNTGTEPLIIHQVQTTCGCTAVDWPKGKTIAPNNSENITVSFNSTGKQGRQHKIVLLISNAVNYQEKIELIGNVLP